MSKKNFELAESAGAIFITQAKDNQKNLKQQIEHRCQIVKPFAYCKDTVTLEHGRIERREYEAFNATDILGKLGETWQYVRTIIRVTRRRHELKKGGPSCEVSYYVSNGIISG